MAVARGLFHKSSARPRILSLALLLVLSGLMLLPLPSAQANAKTLPINLSNNAGESAAPDIAVSGSHIYVVWEDDTTPDWQVLFSESADGGVTWSHPVNISNDTGPAYGPPTVAASKNFVYIVWTDGSPWPDNAQQMMRISPDYGATWGVAFDLSNTADCGEWCAAGLDPYVAVSGSDVYVAWSQCTGCPVNEEIMFRMSSDNGSTWGSTTQLSFTPYYSFDPRISISGDYVYVVWTDNGFGINTDIVYARSTDGGATFSPQVFLTPEASVDWYFGDVASSGSNVYVTFYQTEGYGGVCPCELEMFGSTDHGASFGTWVTLDWLSTTTLDGGSGPGSEELAASGSNIYVTWVDSPLGNFQVYSLMSEDQGSTWGLVSKVSGDSGFQLWPTVAANGVGLYRAWGDETPGNYDVYFLSSPQQPVTVRFACNHVIPTSTFSLTVGWQSFSARGKTATFSFFLAAGSYALPYTVTGHSFSESGFVYLTITNPTSHTLLHVQVC